MRNGGIGGRSRSRLSAGCLLSRVALPAEQSGTAPNTAEGSLGVGMWQMSPVQSLEASARRGRVLQGVR